MSDNTHPYYPFDSGYFHGRPMMTIDSVDRCDQIGSFTLDQCLIALCNPKLHLQKTVKQKLEARIRRLEKARNE